MSQGYLGKPEVEVNWDVTFEMRSCHCFLLPFKPVVSNDKTAYFEIFDVNRKGF